MSNEAVKTYRDLVCYSRSFDLAMDVFKITASYPKEEKYALVDQMRRSARSIPANIAEGWAKRKYENVFKRHLIDAIGSVEELKVWLEFSTKSNYLQPSVCDSLMSQYIEISKMLEALHTKWKTYP